MTYKRKLTHKQIWMKALQYTSFSHPIRITELFAKIVNDWDLSKEDTDKVVDVLIKEYKKYKAKALLCNKPIKYYPLTKQFFPYRHYIVPKVCKTYLKEEKIAYLLNNFS